MPNQKIFCNTPWYDLHIYWDGSLGICCQESHKLYTDGDARYNISSMSITEWYNSEPVRNFRTEVLGNAEVSQCQRCTVEEKYGNDSRRLKSNQKSVIFTKTAFDASWQQSPGFKHFDHSIKNNGVTTSYPVDLHIDLGNYCNLACKMCNANASSSIASQEVKWGIQSSKKFLGQDWTRDQQTWTNFKNQLLEIPGLNNIHFMGGETLLTDRLEDLVDHMIEHQRFDMCFSFVTNGTVYKPQLMEKLTRFKRVGIEVSMESLGQQNTYVRQGTDTNAVLENIKKFESWCNNDNITVTIRTAPGLLSIGTYSELLRWALSKQLIIKSNMVIKPGFLDIKILPTDIKSKYLLSVDQLLSELESTDMSADYNASDPSNIKQVIKAQAMQCRAALLTPQPTDSNALLEQLVAHCKKWDAVYDLDARLIYPELVEIWNQYGY